jgi:hypothetical protein
MERIAPIFAVHDLEAVMEHHQRLGFAVRAYPGGGYGGVVPEDNRRVSAAYLFVDDSDDLAVAWRSAGVEVHSPQDTEWGQREGRRCGPGRQRDPLWLADWVGGPRAEARRLFGAGGRATWQ